MAAPPSRGLRTLAEIEAAGARLGAAMPPLTQEQVDRVAALIAPYWPKREDASPGDIS
jgi:hypothetical protein